MNIQNNLKYSFNEIYDYIQINSHLLDKDIKNIICFIYKINVTEFMINKEKSFTMDVKLIHKIIKNYSNKIPIQYLTNAAFFIDQYLYIKKPILIPRPETEELVLVALKKFHELKLEAKNFLDIGTGTGAIANHLAKIFTDTKIIALDTSGAAIKVARKNVADKKNVQCVKINIKKFLIQKNGTKFNLVISNPPYISLKEINNVSKQTLRHESKKALFAKKNGLFFYKLFFYKLPDILDNHFLLALEIGYMQKDSIIKLIKESTFFNKINFEFYKDINHKDRILLI